MKPNWLQSLFDIYNISKKKLNTEVIVTGFNCNKSCKHKIIKKDKNYVVKSSIGGINMFFHYSIYNTIFKDILQNNNLRKKRLVSWDWNIVKKAKENNIKLIAITPSVIQHIGVLGLWSTEDKYDYAEDF